MYKLIRTVSQLTKEYTTSGTSINTLKIISLEIFRTWIILLHAHPQVVYCNCEVSSVKEELRLQDKDRQTNRKGDSYIPDHQNTLFAGGGGGVKIQLISKEYANVILFNSNVKHKIHHFIHKVLILLST